jgi:hypothetical protein
MRVAIYNKMLYALQAAIMMGNLETEQPAAPRRCPRLCLEAFQAGRLSRHAYITLAGWQLPTARPTAGVRHVATLKRIGPNPLAQRLHIS